MEEMSLAESAVYYAEKGLQVIPLVPNDKPPAVSFANREPFTTEEIKRFWQTNPNYNIGVLTTVFFSFDIDSPNGHATDGFKTVAGLKDKEKLLPPTLSFTTATGGRQLLYMKPPGWQGRQATGLLPGIDIKGMNHNYVVFPPSTINGRGYHWDNSKAKIERAPDELIKFIEAHLSNSFTANHPKDFENGRRIKKYTGWLFDRIATGAAKGNRNTWLTSITGTLLRLGTEPINVYELVNAINNYFIDPPLPEQEVNLIFNSIVERELKNFDQEEKQGTTDRH